MSHVAICLLVLLALVGNGRCAKKQLGELAIEVVEKPDSCAEVAASGDAVAIEYTGKRLTGETFDTSRGKAPFKFKLGEGKTIPGFEQGIVGMCVGEKRVLTIPPHLGYGDAGHPPAIPPKATLKFDVELVELNKAPLLSSGSFGTTLSTAVPLFAFGFIIYYLYQKAQAEDTGKPKKLNKATKAAGKRR